MSLDYHLTLVPQGARLEGELRLPPGEHLLETATWVPGAYAFLRYGRDLCNVHTSDGPAKRVGYTGFQVAHDRVKFTAILADPTWTELAGSVTSEYAIVHATRLPFVRALQDQPVRVHLTLPPGWSLHVPGGLPIEDGVLTFPSFAAFFDTPLVCGAYVEVVRDEPGAQFHHVCVERAVGQETELANFVDDMQKLVRVTQDALGPYPFTHYTFVWGFDPRAEWGLEHANATLVGVGPLALVDPDARFGALRVGVHELVHAWNVCRLKPAALTKPDLVEGSFPGELWIAEGFTRYYEFLLMVRAGLCTPARFFSNIARYHQAVTERPAYVFTSPQDSSLATFVNHTRYPNSPNSGVDYYALGMLVAFDLDAQLQAKGSSLDVVFRELYARYLDAGYTHEQACALFAEYGVDAASEASHAAALTTLAQLEQLGFSITHKDRPALGAVLDGERFVHVLTGSAAEAAGLHPDDRLIAHDGNTFNAKALTWLIANREEFEVVIRRGGHLHTKRVRPQPHRELHTLNYSGATAALLEQWLGAPLAAGEVSLEHYDTFHGVERLV